MARKDRDFLRFLWWTDGQMDSPVEDYRMTVHLFGAFSFPSCANFALQKTEDDFKAAHGHMPNSSDTILTSTTDPSLWPPQLRQFN